MSDNGHAKPTSNALWNGYTIGQWVTKQRAKRNHLSPEQKKRLEALPGWVWNAKVAAWEEGLAHLEAFATDQGHARPVAALIYNDYRLGQWVTTQRNRRETLTEGRRERLEALPGWTWDGRSPKNQ